MAWSGTWPGRWRPTGSGASGLLSERPGVSHGRSGQASAISHQLGQDAILGRPRPAGRWGGPPWPPYFQGCEWSRRSPVVATVCCMRSRALGEFCRVGRCRRSGRGGDPGVVPGGGQARVAGGISRGCDSLASGRSVPRRSASAVRCATCKSSSTESAPTMWLRAGFMGQGGSAGRGLGGGVGRIVGGVETSANVASKGRLMLPPGSWDPVMKCHDTGAGLDSFGRRIPTMVETGARHGSSGLAVAAPGRATGICRPRRVERRWRRSSSSLRGRKTRRLQEGSR